MLTDHLVALKIIGDIVVVFKKTGYSVICEYESVFRIKKSLIVHIALAAVCNLTGFISVSYHVNDKSTGGFILAFLLKNGCRIGGNTVLESLVAKSFAYLKYYITGGLTCIRCSRSFIVHLVKDLFIVFVSDGYKLVCKHLASILVFRNTNELEAFFRFFGNVNVEVKLEVCVNSNVNLHIEVNYLGAEFCAKIDRAVFNFLKISKTVSVRIAPTKNSVVCYSVFIRCSIFVS